MYLAADDRSMLSRMADSFQTLRTVYVDMTVTQAVILLTVGARPGVTQADLCKLTGLSTASASRISRFMADVPIRNETVEPLGLIEFRLSRLDGRSRELFLTQKGERLMRSMLNEYAGTNYNRPKKDS